MIQAEPSTVRLKIQHVPYEIPPGKHGVYETLWKIRCVELINSVYKDVADRGTICVLDFGCGRGELLQLLKENGYSPYGVDMDPECVRLASRFGECVKGSYSDLPKIFPEKHFDVACALHVLEHVPAPLECVQHLVKVTKSYLVFSVPNLCTPVRLEYKRRIRIPVNPGHVVGWDFSHFRNFLEVHCGLEVVRFLPDVVQVPHFSNLLWRIGLGQKIEVEFLPRVFPYLSHSITVLCRIPAS